jgi:hypothetical protein
VSALKALAGLDIKPIKIIRSHVPTDILMSLTPPVLATLGGVFVVTTPVLLP